MIIGSDLYGTGNCLAQYPMAGNGFDSNCFQYSDMQCFTTEQCCMANNNNCNNNCGQNQKCCEPCEETLGLNVNYIFPLGLIRLAIIGLLIGGLVAAWCIPQDLGLFYSQNGAFSSTRSAYIVLVSATVGIDIFIFLVSISNFVNLPGVQSVAWLFGISFIDIMSAASMIGVGVAACVRESQINVNDYIDTFRQGAFAAAGALALLAVLLYGASLIASAPYIINYLGDSDDC